MGEHHGNPFAMAKAARGREAEVMNVADLGDGVGFLGVGLEPRLTQDGFSVFLTAKVGKVSELVGISAIATVPLGQVFSGAMADFKAAAAKALGIELPEAKTS